MTLEEQYTKMEKEISGIKENVDAILQLVQKMDVGLYGDTKNRHKGVIEKQTDLEEEIDNLRHQILEINKRNDSRDIEAKTKKSLRSKLIDVGESIIKVAIQVIAGYLVLKGILGPDSLLKL